MIATKFERRRVNSEFEGKDYRGLHYFSARWAHFLSNEWGRGRWHAVLDYDTMVLNMSRTFDYLFDTDADIVIQVVEAE